MRPYQHDPIKRRSKQEQGGFFPMYRRASGIRLLRKRSCAMGCSMA